MFDNPEIRAIIDLLFSLSIIFYMIVSLVDTIESYKARKAVFRKIAELEKRLEELEKYFF